MSDLPATSSMEQSTETVEKTPPNGIKGLATSESWWTPEHVIALVLPLLTLLVIAWAVLTLLSRKRKSKTESAVEVQDPWRQLGLMIQNMKQPELSFSEKSAEQWILFASEVSLAARQIAGTATGEPCDDWTTDEFLRALPRLAETSNSKSSLDMTAVAALLQDTDLIRFAGRAPQSISATGWIDQLKRWYEQEETYRSRGVIS